MEKTSQNKQCTFPGCIAGSQYWLLVILPRPKIMLSNITYCNSTVKYEIYSSAPGLMTLRECCIDHPFSYHMTGVG